MEQHLRMCIACRNHIDKKMLKRVVREPSGEISVDNTGKKNGRGAYVCCIECLNKCKKAKLLNKSFKCAVSDEVYDKLAEEF